MLIYIILYMLLLLSALADRDHISLSSKKKVLYWLVVIFTLFRGLRWDTGTDWDQYLSIFLRADWDRIFTFARNKSVDIEPGYIFLNVLIKTLGGNYTVFLLVTNLFIMYTYVKFALSNSRNPILVFVLIMFSTQFFPVRIGIAVALIMFGLCGFSRNRHLRVMAFTAMAISVHSSSMVFIPVYLMIFMRKIPTNLAVGIAFCWLQLVQIPAYNDVLFSIAGDINFLGDEVAHKFENYLDYDPFRNTAVNVVSGYLSSMIFIVLLWVFGNMLKQDDLPDSDRVDYGFLFNVYFVFMMIAIAFPGDRMAGLRRLQNYFMFAFPLLFATYIVHGRAVNYRYKAVFTMMFVGYCLFRVYTLFFGREWYVHFPYRSVLDHVF